MVRRNVIVVGERAKSVLGKSGNRLAEEREVSEQARERGAKVNSQRTRERVEKVLDVLCHARDGTDRHPAQAVVGLDEQGGEVEGEARREVSERRVGKA